VASVVFFACIAPWLVRNYETFGKFIFIRDNFGAELRLGNGPGADGTLMLHLDATHDADAMRQFQTIGESPYIAMRKWQALDYIEADYARFADLCVKRFFYFWAGPPKATNPWWMSEVKNSLFLAWSVLAFCGLVLALRLRKPGSWLLFWLFVVYPAIYYFVYSIPRYRHPIEPEMAMLVPEGRAEITTEGGLDIAETQPSMVHAVVGEGVGAPFLDRWRLGANGILQVEHGLLLLDVQLAQRRRLARRNQAAAEQQPDPATILMAICSACMPPVVTKNRSGEKGTKPSAKGLP